MSEESAPGATSAPAAPARADKRLDITFDAFVQHHYATWVKFACLNVGDDAAATSVVNDVVLQLHESWAHVLTQASVEGYTLNLIKTAIAQWRTENSVPEAFVDNASFLSAISAGQWRFDLLEEAISRYSAIAALPERQFHVIVLRYVLGCSENYVAQLLGISVETTRSHIHHARKRLAHDLNLHQAPDPTSQADGAGSGDGRAAGQPSDPSQTTDPIDDLLRDARVLDREYAGRHTPATPEILAAARAERTAQAARALDSGADGHGTPAPAPPTSRPEHEQARHELNLATTLVLNTPQTAARLSRMEEDQFPDPEGALLIACLLHLAGREHAARYWWKFAAGGGNPTAAYCLYLEHRSHAEYRDAEHWLGQSVRLRAEPWHRPADDRAARTPRAAQPRMPVHELRDLLAQCHYGRLPHRSPAAEGAISQLSVPGEKSDSGEPSRPYPGWPAL
jgi:RNA polymerase sigma factor (sigma-70 family)